MTQAAMKRCAVLGTPVEHSLSPVIHTRAYEVLGLADQWHYERHQIDIPQLGDFVAGCGPEWVGLSCTAPLKAEVLRMGEPSATARTLDSANTIVFNHEGGPNLVENTDVTGLTGMLARVGVTEARTAMLVGNGATARSTLYALAQLGVDAVLVLARSADKARESLDGLAKTLGIRWEVAPWGTVPDHDAVDILVSTVSAELPAGVADALIGLTRVSFEATYNSYPSQFDVAARAAGITQLSGIDLLVGQALDQIRLMTGRSCAPEPLLDVAYGALAATS
ncbi:MAG: shikimate dehydrogenase family protein [Propioniciclava sp.]